MDLGQLVKDGFKKVSEVAMDAMVSSIIANQDQHLGHLQDMQKWGIVKIIQRLTSYKYLHQQPCVVPVSDVSLMDAFGEPCQSETATKCHQRVTLPSVGALEVIVGHAKLLLLGHSLTSSDSSIKKFEWKVVVSCDRGSAETHCSAMSRDSQRSPYTWLPEAAKSAEHYTPLHEVHWSEKLVLPDIRDIWSDVVIDVFWRKTFTSSNNVKIGIREPPSPKIAPPDLSPRYYPLEEMPGPSDCKDDKSATGARQKPPMRNDTHPARRKPPTNNAWRLYGRAIIPLSSFLSSYGETGGKPNGKFASSLYRMPSRGERGRFWVHLFPHEADEKKYYKPVAGYPGFGMANPGTTLGFLQVNVHFSFSCPTMIAPIISTCNAPCSRWVNSFSFEPQYLETYGLRARHIMTSFPRWVPKFLHLFTYDGLVTRNSWDAVCVLLFWSSFIYFSLFAPMAQIPICLSFCIFCISMSYRLGHHTLSPPRTAFLYRRKHNMAALQSTVSSNLQYISIVFCDSSQSLTKNFLHIGYFVPQFDKLRCSGSFVDESSVLKIAEHGKNNKGHPRVFGDLTLTSPDCTGSSSRLETDSTTHGYGGTYRLDQTQEHLTSGSTEPRRYVAAFEGSSRDFNGLPSSETGKTVEETALSSHVSVVESPFGPLALTVKDPTSYCPNFPVFADDAGEQDVQMLLEHGLEVLDAVQRMVGVFSFVVEKLKFAFNWEDAFITVSSYCVVFILCLASTTALVISSYLPQWVSRLPLLFPAISFILITDPWIQEIFWIPITGVNLPLLWMSVLSRTPITRQGLKQNLHETEHAERKMIGMKTTKSEPELFHFGVQAREGLATSSSRMTPLERIAVQSDEISVSYDASSSFPSSIISQHEQSWVETPAPKWPKLSKLFGIKSRSRQSEGPSGTSEAPMQQVIHSERTRGVRRRKSGRYSSESNPLAVLGVTASILPTASRYKPLLHPFIRSFPYGFFITVTSSLMALFLKLFYRINQLLLTRLSNFAGFLLMRALRWVDLVGRFLVYWWIRLPDRREIEHRQIAASQFVESLEQLLPPHFSAASTSPPAVQINVRIDRKETDVDRFFDDYFKQSYISRNPISGLLNVRLMIGVPEIPLPIDTNRQPHLKFNQRTGFPRLSNNEFFGAREENTDMLDESLEGLSSHLQCNEHISDDEQITCKGLHNSLDSVSTSLQQCGSSDGTSTNVSIGHVITEVSQTVSRCNYPRSEALQLLFQQNNDPNRHSSIELGLDPKRVVSFFKHFGKRP